MSDPLREMAMERLKASLEESERKRRMKCEPVFIKVRGCEFELMWTEDKVEALFKMIGERAKPISENQHYITEWD